MPNLFIVGPPRSATTSLAAWLARHPDIWMSSPKEPAFYATDLAMRNRMTDRSGYLELFEGGRDLTYRGEATPWYLYSRSSAKAIRKDAPDGQIIVLLRNPVDQLVSLHHYHRYRGIESEPDLERAIRESRSPSTVDFRFSLDYMNAFQVGEQVERFAQEFPSGQIHFVRFDMVQTAPQQAYASLLQALGLPAIELDDYNVRNPSRRRRSRWLFAAAERLTASSSPSRWRTALRYRVSTVNTVPDQATISESLRHELIEVLEPQIHLLEELSGEDLAAWRDA